MASEYENIRLQYDILRVLRQSTGLVRSYDVHYQLIHTGRWPALTIWRTRQRLDRMAAGGYLICKRTRGVKFYRLPRPEEKNCKLEA